MVSLGEDPRVRLERILATAWTKFIGKKGMKMDRISIPGLVRKYLSAFITRDRKTLEDGLAEDFTFTSPRDDHISKASFFERCYPGGDLFRSQVIEQIFESRNEAVVRYLAELNDGTKFRNMEYIRFEGDKIKSVDVYFGANVTG